MVLLIVTPAGASADPRPVALEPGKAVVYAYRSIAYARMGRKNDAEADRRKAKGLER